MQEFSPSVCPCVQPSKISYMMGLFRGRVLEWVEALLGTTGTFSISFTGFLEELQKVFDHSIYADDSAKRLLNIHQGQRSVAEYSIKFRIIAAKSGWDVKALRGCFCMVYVNS